jgi:hypothetical protein
MAIAVLVACVCVQSATADTDDEHTGATQLTMTHLWFSPPSPKTHAPLPKAPTAIQLDNNVRRLLLQHYGAPPPPDAQSPDKAPAPTTGTTFRMSERFQTISLRTADSDGDLSFGAMERVGLSLPKDVRLLSEVDSQGQVDLYDVSLMWDAYEPGPVTFSIIGGVRALAVDPRAAYGVDAGAGGLGSTESQRLIPMPVVGGAVRWAIDDNLYLMGSSAGQALGDSGTFYDLTAEAGYSLGANAGIAAGYRYRRAEAAIEAFDAQFREDGIYARFELRF